MRKALLIVLLASPAYAGNLSNFWVSNGGYKLARQDRTPQDGQSMTGRNWDGANAKLFGAKNEAVSLVLYMGNATGSDVTNVTVQMSDLVSGASVISSTPVLCSGVTDYTTRPVEQFYVRYVPIRGITQNSWNDYDQNDLPHRFKRPCTLNGNNQCSANGGTTWTDRQDHDKDYPEILVPMECVNSFTVAKSSSQAVWFDIYLAKDLLGGTTYTGTITVKENGVTSIAIPLSVEVKNFTLPDAPSLKAVIEMDSQDINYRHQGGTHYDYRGANYEKTRDRYAQLFHRHKFAGTSGQDTINDCNGTGQDYPCPEYVRRLSGSLYQATSGYANGPGVGVGDSVYSIGTYGNWSAEWSKTNAGIFCSHFKNWQDWFASNYPSVLSFVYLSDEVADFTETERWATWMATAPACQTAGYRANSWTTALWSTANTNAPHINMPVSTDWMKVPASTWDTMASNYCTLGSTRCWGYNSHAPWSGSVYATEDDGVGPLATFWQMYKKHVQGWFFWQGTGFTNTSPNSNNDLFNDAKTFGYDSGFDSVKGRTGFMYSNGDGVLVYPGSDTVKTPSYGFDGAIASWRLKQIRRGIQDGDYLAASNAINPTATASIVNAAVPKALWEQECIDPLDCTWTGGGRSWSADPNAWESSREALATIILAAGSAPAPGTFSGSGRLSGAGVLRQ